MVITLSIAPFTLANLARYADLAWTLPCLISPTFVAIYAASCSGTGPTY